MLQIYVLIQIWSGAYRTQSHLDGISYGKTVTYLCVVNMLMWLNQSTIPWYVADRIREGKIATELIRPIPFPLQVLSHQVGYTIARTTALAGMIPVAVVVAGLEAPATVGLFVVSALLSYAVSVGLYGLLGSAGFWLHETSGIVWAFSLVNAFLAGSFIPLALFPPGVREVVELLPFGAMGYTPAAIYSGMVSGAAAVQAVLVQFFWCVTLVAVIALVWRRAERGIVSQGG
ncbi:ABC-2 family transporter protein [Streptosporangium sp. NPDC006007]|uniref:ABC transporter permease n=1 Tax=Streptosporangium sp. NPDC006007 TaxID=3154575 RepID=UPI0033BB04AD